MLKILLYCIWQEKNPIHLITEASLGKKLVRDSKEDSGKGFVGVIKQKYWFTSVLKMNWEASVILMSQACLLVTFLTCPA